MKFYYLSLNKKKKQENWKYELMKEKKKFLDKFQIT